MKRAPFLIALLFSAGSLQAEEQTMKQSVVGLFQPDRVEDLRETVRTLPNVELTSLDYASSEATFRFDPAKLFTNYNPKKPKSPEETAKRLDELLRSASMGTFTLKPVASLPTDKMTKVEIKVGVLDCKGCRYGAYLAIAKLEGVEKATVTGEGLVTAWIDAAKTNQAALEEAMKKGRIELKADK